eukprot:TRINITY_DN1591_c0_g1_i2.p3 TRINITY_DN1591_c0_g1~~TRINITY_DN1591_c0_g1_i2.p3  ORF type:complete len:187 (+),score=38.85 TRINITY_DN1591_c0_g1_i2:87-647(+)
MCIRDRYQRRVHGGVLSKFDLISVLKDSGFRVDQHFCQKVYDELDRRQIRKMDINACIEMGSCMVDWEDVGEEEDPVQNSEFVDAFVAMGGDIDNDRGVQKETIKKILKEEFELAFDIDDYIDSIVGPVQVLDFQTFCKLFDESNDPSRTATRMSLLSAMTDRARKTSSSFNVKYRDFEKFLEHYE